MSQVRELFDRIIEDGVITRAEHDDFMELIHEDGRIDKEESEQISRMFKLISEGKLKIVDEDREAAERKRREKLRETIQAAAAPKK